MQCRALTVLVWALFSVSSTLLGMLPVRGWLWRPDPRPWPAVLAWGVFLSTTVCMNMNMNGGAKDTPSTTGNSLFKSAVMLYLAVLRTLEGYERCRRRGELCALAQCLRLYCAAHPLSPRGWRALLGTALFSTMYGLYNGITAVWWIHKDESAGTGTGGPAMPFARLVWASYSGGLQLYALTLSGITGQLARDLRQDCLRALRAAGAWVPDHNGHVAPLSNDEARLAWSARRRSAAPAARKGVGGMLSGVLDTFGDDLGDAIGDSLEETLDGTLSYTIQDPWRASSSRDEFCWRRLRVRHMVLLDMGWMASAITCWQVLVMIIYSVTYSATCVSTAVDSLVDMQDSPLHEYSVRDTLVPLQAGIGRLLLFLFACYNFQRAAQEHSKLSQELQGFLADTPDVPVAVIREVEKFIVQIGLLDGYFDVLGLFRLDIGAMRTILAAAATYLFVLMQFGISMY